MQIEQIRALLKEAQSLNAVMGKVAVPCFKCLWTERGPDCVDNDWHRHDDINQKLAAALELLNETQHLGQ